MKVPFRACGRMTAPFIEGEPAPVAHRADAEPMLGASGRRP